MKLRLHLLLAPLLASAAACSSGDPDGDAPAASDGYPLTTCVVSGNALDSMGGPVEYEHEGKRVLFCCDGCVSVFEGSPDEYLSQVYPENVPAPGER